MQCNAMQCNVCMYVCMYPIETGVEHSIYITVKSRIHIILKQSTNRVNTQCCTFLGSSVDWLVLCSVYQIYMSAPELSMSYVYVCLLLFITARGEDTTLAPSRRQYYADNILESLWSFLCLQILATSFLTFMLHLSLNALRINSFSDRQRSHVFWPGMYLVHFCR